MEKKAKSKPLEEATSEELIDGLAQAYDARDHASSTIRAIRIENELRKERIEKPDDSKSSDIEQ